MNSEGSSLGQGQVSSIRFVDNIIGNLGAPVRDGSLDEFEDETGAGDIDADIETGVPPRNCEEVHMHTS